MSPITAGCSKISFSMKWRWLPLPIMAPLKAVCRIGRSTSSPAGVMNHGALGVQEGDVAFLEVLDAVGQGGQRQRVRAHKHLVVAVADGERAALAGDDQEIGSALEQHGEREGAFEPADSRRRGLLGAKAAGEVGADSWGTTSVSVWVVNSRPLATSSARSA